MNNLITDLVDRFDRGTLSRRQLMQGLTALAAAGGALPAAAQQAPFKSSRLDPSASSTISPAGFCVRDPDGVPVQIVRT